MKSTLIFFILFLYSNKTFTQDWTQTYENSGEVMDVINTNDGGYALISHFNFTPSKFIKTDIDGNVEWTHTLEPIDSISQFNFYSLAQNSNGDYFISGYYGTNSNEEGGIVVLKYLEDGSPSWNRFIPCLTNYITNHNFRASSSDILNNNSLGILGNTNNNGFWASTLFVLDPESGSTLDSIIIGGTNIQSCGYSLLELNNGGFLIGCEVSTSTNYVGPAIIHIDEGGSIDSLYTEFGVGGRVQELIPSLDGTFLGVTNAGNVLGWAIGTSSSIFKFDLQEGLVWEVDFEYENAPEWAVFEYATTIWENCKGDITAIGWPLTKVEYNSSGIKTNEEILDLGIPSSDFRIYSSIIDQNDNLVLSGGEYSQDAILMSLDSAFCFTTSISEIDIFDKPLFSIYPNPLTTSTTFQLSDTYDLLELRVFDTNGRMVKTIKTSGKEFVFRKMNLSQGFYLFNLYGNNDYLGNGKLIIK